jgi:hypothetical protein
VAVLPDLPHRLFHRGVALDATAVRTPPRKHAAAKVSCLLDLYFEVREDGEEALPPVPDPVVAAIGLAPFNLSQVRDELHVGVTEGEESIEVAPVEGVHPLVKQLDALLRYRVLVRHRPRSISRGSCAFMQSSTA